jgi:hypothetical protein
MPTATLIRRVRPLPTTIALTCVCALGTSVCLGNVQALLYGLDQWSLPTHLWPMALREPRDMWKH